MPTDRRSDAGLAAALDRLAAGRAREQLDRIEAQIPVLIDHLAAAGIPAVLLKGPVTRRRLYGPEELRPVADVDLLVPARLHRRARRRLARLGYRRLDWSGHSDSLTRRDTATTTVPVHGHSNSNSNSNSNGHGNGNIDVDVDLHLTLPYARCGPRRAFRVLRPHVTSMVVAGASVAVLDVPAHVVHLALHAAQNSFAPEVRATDEWQRAAASLAPDELDAAERLVDDLGVREVWSVARRALVAPADHVGLAATLPVRTVGPSVASIRAFLRSPVAPHERWRIARRFVRRQCSAEMVNYWRTHRGMEPLPLHGMAMQRARVVRVVTVVRERLGAVGGRR